MAFPGRYIKLLLSAIFWIGCVIGFIFQSKEVNDIYFKYEIHTSTIMTIPTEISTPSLSLCHLYVFILNRTEYQKYGLRKTVEEDVFSDGHRFLTIEQLFNLTSKGDDTISGCGQRQGRSWNFGGTKSCTNDITVSKYYMQEFICYMYSFPGLARISIGDAAQAVKFVNTVYVVTLKDVPTSHVFYTFAHPPGSMPYLSRNFGKQVDRKTSSTGVTEPNKIFLTFRETTIHRLPPPYATSCTKDKMKDKVMCNRNCLIAAMETIDRFPDTEITTEPVNLRHAGALEFENATSSFRDDVTKKYQQCESHCRGISRDLCDTTFMTSNIDLHTDTVWMKDKLEVRLLVPDSPSIEINYKASMSILDYIVYMCSSFGMWFGLSFASLNPNGLYVHVNKFFRKSSHRKSTSVIVRIDRCKSQIEELKIEINRLRDICSRNRRSTVRR